MASIPDFKLVSAATAIAIIAAPEHHPEINKLRIVHDKAYHKWQPHINILYPFVQPPQLDNAVALLKTALQKSNFPNLNIKTDEVGVFTHRKNATLFLKPDLESIKSIGGLRKCLVEALGREESDGTHDGMFRPHLTIGQAGLQGDSVERLSEKIKRLVGFEWECCSLAVLKRKTTGEMEVVDILSLEDKVSERRDPPIEITASETGWSPCFTLNKDKEWETYSQVISTHSSDIILPKEITIVTYNLMAEPIAPPFVNRVPLILDAVTSATHSAHGLRVLCLQEVNEEILLLLLKSPQIQRIYQYSTHTPSSVFESKRNLVTLASKPFTSFNIDFAERHKSSLVIKALNPNIMVANVHLTSALTDISVAAKARQMATLTNFLRKDSERNVGPIFVAGDFNLTSSLKTIETALVKRIITPSTAAAVKNIIDENIWEDAFLKYIDFDSGEEHEDEDSEQESKGEEGVTFDRLNNPLAALSKGPVDERPQRYDRILWLKNEGVQVEVESVERFGFPDEKGECGSDHYGVCATMSLSRSATIDTLSSSNELPIRAKTGDVRLVPDETDLTSLLGSYMPTEEDKAQRVSAIEVLKETLGGDVILAPLGSYAMDTYFPDSDIDLLVIGTVSPRTFFETAQEHLKALRRESSPEDGIKGLHFVNSLVPIIEVVVRGIKIDLQYCQATELVSRYNTTTPKPDLRTLVFEDSLISTLSPSSLRPLNTYRDTAYLLNTIPNLNTYKTAHRFLSLYLKNRGLYSAKFGYLGGIHLSLLLNKIVKSIPASALGASIVRSFFTYYASFNWAGEVVMDPAANKDRIARSAREAIVIQSIHAPTARPNVASSCTRLSAQTISKEFALAVERLEKGDNKWCLRPKKDSISEFVHGSGAFVKITLDMWNLDDIGVEKVREIIGGLESKITGLMVGLGRIEGMEGRVWPERFAEGKQEDDEDQVKAIYLVGISAKGGNEEEKKLVTGKVLQASRFFERTVMEMRGFEKKRMWVGVEVVSRKKVLAEGLIVDGRIF